MTSRGALTNRTTYIIEAQSAGGIGYGECCVMPGLLPEPTPKELDFWCAKVSLQGGLFDIEAPSPVRFGIETAVLSALSIHKTRWDTPFSRGEEGLPIHHLIWMADAESMLDSIKRGMDDGFKCLKMKVGAIPFEQELELLKLAHGQYPDAEIRVDANGAFSPAEALPKLKLLADAGVSFIEQPIKPGQWEAMATLCRLSPLPIALDEELITTPDAERMLDMLHPHAIVIKPSLHGGLMAAERWAALAEARGIEWWVNSALESNIGLTALAEWCAFTRPGHMQGLGTGQLFTDNLPGAVRLSGNKLIYMPITTPQEQRL